MHDALIVKVGHAFDDLSRVFFQNIMVQRSELNQEILNRPVRQVLLDERE